MTRVAAATSALIVYASATVGAHRLDEYLQAARVAVLPSAIEVHLDLTPGVAIADGIVSRLDSDGDGRISPGEAEAYGRTVQGDLRVSVDGGGVPLTLTRVEVPTIGELRDGTGTIRVDFSATPAARTSRHHRLELSNTHLPDRSVYLANALMPATNEVGILRQERDVRQQTLRIEYATQPAAAAPALWMLGGVAGLAVHARWRLGRAGRRT